MPASSDDRGEGASLPLTSPVQLAASLAALGRETSSTLATVVLAGFALLLARLTGEEDLAVGVPVSGRDLAEAETLAGTFVNTVIIRITLDPPEDLRAFLARARAAARSAFAHDALPFERLVSALHVAREPGRIPLVRAMLIVHTTPPPVITAAGVEAVPLDLHRGAPLCDLTLSLRPGPQGLAGSIVYDPASFDAATIARYGDHLLALLAAMPSSLDRPLRELPDLGAQERRRILVELNATARPHDLLTPIHRRIAAQAARTPSAVAVIAGARAITYAELDRASARVASSLQASGLRPGSLVPILAGRSLDAVIAILGVLVRLEPLDEGLRLFDEGRCAAFAELLVEPPRLPRDIDRLEEGSHRHVLGLSCPAGDMLDRGGECARTRTSEQCFDDVAEPRDLLLVVGAEGADGSLVNLHGLKAPPLGDIEHDRRRGAV